MYYSAVHKALPHEFKLAVYNQENPLGIMANESDASFTQLERMSGDEMLLTFLLEWKEASDNGADCSLFLSEVATWLGDSTLCHGA